MTRVQIAVSTDMEMFEPTLVSVMSALESCSSPATVHVFGLNLTDGARSRLDRAVRLWPGSSLEVRDVDSALISDWNRGARVQRHSPAVLAILHIPKTLDGRVLYLDSDLLVQGDIAPLFALELGGGGEERLVAAVRDYQLLLQRFQSFLGSADRALNALEELLNPHPVTDFFNSGFVLFDTDAIKAEPGLADAIADTSGDLLEDSEILNQRLKGRAMLLDPSWNVLAGMHCHYGPLHAGMVPDGEPYLHTPPRVLHFYGIVKPWHDVDTDLLMRDFHGALRHLSDAIDLERIGKTPDELLFFLTSRVSIAEYICAVRSWRAAHGRYTHMIDG